MKRGAIFDLDGVIVDTARYHYLAWKRLAAELGFGFSEEENERLKGVSRMRSLELLLECGGQAGRFAPSELAALASKKNEWYRELIVRITANDAVPGAMDFLTACRERGIRTALGSGSSNAAIVLDKLRLRPLFDAVVDGTRTKKAKPDPEVFLLGARDLGLKPAECVVFEDAQAGIEAARAAGMGVVGIGRKEDLAGWDFIMRDFREADIRAIFC